MKGSPQSSKHGSLTCAVCHQSWFRKSAKLPVQCAKCTSKLWDGRDRLVYRDAGKRHTTAMIGNKFGRLTVLSYAGKNGYLCRCDCGGETIAKGWGLKNGKHRSCVCGLRADRKRLGDHIAAKRGVKKNYVGAAKRRGYEFSLTEDEFFRLIVGNCHYCGTVPSMNRAESTTNFDIMVLIG